MGANHYGQPLAVRVTDGKLVIEIGIHVLAHAVSYADWANVYDEDACEYVRTFAITNPEQFAKDVARALQREQEDGSSPLSNLLDDASEAALDDGSEAAEYKQRIQTGQFSPLETWATLPRRRGQGPSGTHAGGERAMTTTHELVGMVDGRCSCASCVARTENIYRMIGVCKNCGAKPILMLFRVGDPARELDCPKCGRWHGVMPQRLATDDEIPVAALSRAVEDETGTP